MAYTADDYASWIVKNEGKKGTPEFDTVAKAYQEAKGADVPPVPPIQPDASAIDRTQAFAAGVNKGVVANTAGLPVDTALNVADLARAGYNFLGNKLGLVKASDMPDPLDRAKYAGSSDWIANHIRDAGGGKAIDPNVPSDRASRVLYAGGQGVGGSLLGGPTSVPGMVRGAVGGGASTALAQGAQEAGASPAIQVLASLAPAVGPMIPRTQQQALSTRDQAILRAQQNGYVFPPSVASPENAGTLNLAMERLAGKTATQQGSQVKNQRTTQALTAQDFGMSPDALSRDALEQFRSQQGQAYQNVKQVATKTDATFPQEVSQAFAPYDQRLAQFPNSTRNSGIEGLRQDLNLAPMPGWPVDTAAAVEQIKQLRSDATANRRADMAPDQRALGRVQGDAADALENLIDRNLASTNQQDLLQAYRDARVAIAKAYTAERAINPTTGEVDANKLAANLRKGKPISGGMRSAAEAASTAPGSLAVPKSAPGVSKLDAIAAMGSAVSAAATHQPWFSIGALQPAISSAARGILLSPAWQRHMVGPQRLTGRGLLDLLTPQDQAGLLGAMATRP